MLEGAPPLGFCKPSYYSVLNPDQGLNPPHHLHSVSQVRSQDACAFETRTVHQLSAQPARVCPVTITAPEYCARVSDLSCSAQVSASCHSVPRAFVPRCKQSHKWVQKGVALDLFSGKGSVTVALQRANFRVVSVDINPRFRPTHCVDILCWDFRQYPPGYFQVIAAHAPCTEYSRAKTIGERDYLLADRLIAKTLEIVAYFQPQIWWLENPRTGFLCKRDCVKNLDYIDIDYCQFSEWGYQKPTRLWSSQNITRLTDRVCDGVSCKNLIEGTRRHRKQLGGKKMRFSAQQKWCVPEGVIHYLL